MAETATATATPPPAAPAAAPAASPSISYRLQTHQAANVPNRPPMEGMRRKAPTAPPVAKTDPKPADAAPAAPLAKAEAAQAKVEASQAVSEPAKVDSKPATEAPATTAPSDVPWKGENGEVKILDETTVRGMKSGALTKYNRALVEENQKLRNKTSAPVSVAEHPEFKAMSEKLQQRDAELAKLSETLKFVDYEKTGDYQEEYFKPYNDAFNQARTRVSGLKVQEIKDANTDEVIQPARQATPDDFDKLALIQDDNDAADLAYKLFGPRATIALNLRDQVLGLNAKKEAALDDHRKNGETRMAEATKNREASAKQQQTIYQTEMMAGIDKNPHLFKAPEGDTVAQDKLAKGIEFADSVFAGGKVKDENGNIRVLTPAELAKRHAIVRNKAAGFDMQVHINAKLRVEVKALTEKVNGLMASDPGNGEGRGQQGGTNGNEDILTRVGKFATLR